ncbi:gamma carbonic anhydrase family protein [Corynebacterium amycolatum]|uniref:gamma carbonic anhydrase family protein n=1 Tax=Corynebacterium amycolatum TaxID=43765 RepID=UPI000E153AA4|nr:gamma carbonic anhydrase family protein [Corynebacterium amycolatum]STC40732.1 Gamma-type carbonic anhydratase-like protein [Corynebacterium amycolatum]
MMNTPLILTYQDKTPRIHSSAWIAPGAVIIGDVEIGADSSVFYGSVLRGDVAPIRIGQRTNIQDNSTVHVDRGVPTILGDDVTVGHMALVHGTTVEDGCLIGMKSTLLSRSRIGAGSLIAAGAVVLEDQVIDPGSLAAGVPAKVRRRLSAEEAEGFITHAGRYVETASNHRHLREVDLDMVTFN